MIDETVLERLLHAEAATYEPPRDGPARVLDAAAGERERAPGRKVAWLAAAAAVLVVAVAVPMAGRTGLQGMTASDRGGVGGGENALKDTAYDGDDAGAGGKQGVETGPHVVRTGDVTVEVAKARVGETLRAVSRLVTTLGGFVAESSTETAGDQPAGWVTLRVPVASFERAVDEVGRLGEVVGSSTRGEDVSDQVTDLAARLKSLTATRAQLRTLLGRARNVGEVLAVQDQLTEVQTQIEQLQARQQTLTDRTSFGTLRVGVVSPGTADRSGFAGAWHDARTGFVGGFEWLVAASGPIAFLLIVGAVLLVLGRKAYRYWVRGVA